MNRFHRLLFAILVCCVLPVTAVAQPVFEWARRIGGRDVDAVTQLATDKGGNVYVAGFFWGTAGFTADTGVIRVASAGAYDIFLARYDSSGRLNWVQRMGGPDYDVPTGIAVDDSGHVFLTGYFQNTSVFDPKTGGHQLTCAGVEDVFLARYDSSGNCAWAIRVGGSVSDVSFGLALDRRGNVCMAGYFQGKVDFDPGPDSAFLSSHDSPVGPNPDGFLAMYDVAGRFRWADAIGGEDTDLVSGIITGTGGDLYVVGKFKGTATFGEGGVSRRISGTGEGDGFLARYGSDGKFVWVRDIGGPGDDYCSGIAGDSSGNLAVTGRFRDGTDFDPGSGSAYPANRGADDAFVAGYDSSGNFRWVNTAGGSGVDIAVGVAMDQSGNSYVTGNFLGTIFFDGAGGLKSFTSAGNRDMFLARYDTAGKLTWAQSFGDRSDDNIARPVLNGFGDLFIMGAFGDTVAFTPGNAAGTLKSAGSLDGFFIKYLGPRSGVPDEPPAGTLVARPNPVRDVLTIDLGKCDNAVCVQCTDILGRLVSVPVLVQGTKVRLDMSGLPAGMYTVRAVGRSAGGSLTKIILKD